MKMLTIADFEPLLGQLFLLEPAGEPSLSLELVEVNRLAWQPLDREPFSLVFQGPHSPRLDQGTYPLRCVSGDRTDQIFLVPISADDSGRYYEANFN